MKWAQNKSAGRFPPEASSHQSFEHFYSGRSCVVVRTVTESDEDIWAVRIDDPDKTKAGRIWTTEITVTSGGKRASRFTLRLLVGSSENSLDIEPHVPGVVRQLISRPGLYSGSFKITDKALTIKTEGSAARLIEALIDPARTIPLIVLTVPADCADLYKPRFDAQTLALACAGLATVIVLPAQFTWMLTERFGKRLSVYEGAARIYLGGFTEDANPFGGHDLILGDRFLSKETVSGLLTKLRWIAASSSLRRLILGTDIIAFATLRLRALGQRGRELLDEGAPDKEQLEAALQKIATLEEQAKESERFLKQFSDLHDAAENRAETAESQVKASGFRIQQLLEQIKEGGVSPDANIPTPTEWSGFADWCETNLAGRVALSPQARRSVKVAQFGEATLAAKALLWLANDFRAEKLGGGGTTLRDRSIEEGLLNSHCGTDTFSFDWQGKRCEVSWHVKNGGNTRDPVRCLRIYYFWDESSQQVVVASLPAHRTSDAS